MFSGWVGNCYCSYHEQIICLKEVSEISLHLLCLGSVLPPYLTRSGWCLSGLTEKPKTNRNNL